MPVPRHGLRFSLDTWPQTDASRVSNLVDSAVLTSLKNIWRVRVQSAFVFGVIQKLQVLLAKGFLPPKEQEIHKLELG